jgi:hypothetical protein
MLLNQTLHGRPSCLHMPSLLAVAYFSLYHEVDTFRSCLFQFII